MTTPRHLYTAILALSLLAGCDSSQPDQKQSGSPQASSPPATPIAGPSKPTTSAPVAPPATAPTTQPREIVGFSQERFRLVHDTDEIVSVLDNGAVIIAKRVVGSPVLSVRGYVKTGGIYEGQWLGGGLSHLLEHLVAGGSNTRRDEAQGREILQQLGNNSNAYTTTNHTAYFINTTPVNLEKAVDLLTGWLLHATITEDEFRREYQVVQRELEMGRGESSRQFYYMLNMNRYQVSPVRVPVIGFAEVIQGLSRDDVYNYYRKAYTPNNMVFTVAGDLAPELMLKTVQQYIDAPAGRAFETTIRAEPAVLSPRTSVTTMPKLGEARVDLTFPSIRLDHPDLYALDLLAAVLGQSESSPLVREIRDRRIVSSISAYSHTPEYVEGGFGVQFQVQPNKLDAAIEAVQLILEKAKREPFDEAVVKRAITQMRVQQLREQQETENVAATMATDYLSTGDVHFTQKYLARLATVTPADLQAVARKYFDNQKLIKTIMLPEEATNGEGLPRAEQLLRQAGEQASTSTATTRPDAEVQRTMLENGTVLLVRHVPTSPLISVRMYASGGLTAEDAATTGIGNLTMRMLTRGTSFRSANQLAEELEALGASVDTACGNNSWYWTASMLKEDFDKGMELFADVVANPAFPDSELESMRSRVLAAIAAQDADWSSQAMRFFKQRYFPQTSPYRLQVIGEADTVKAFTPDALKEWYQQKVLTGRRVLAIYGDIDPDRARQVAMKYLGAGPKSQAAAPPLPGEVRGVPVADVPQIAIERVEVQKTQQALAGIIIGFNAKTLIGEKDHEIVAVADTVTSGWGYPTGYLHETLRGEGLVYVVAASNWPGRTKEIPGTFFVYAGCEPSRVNLVVERILLNIARLQGSPQDIQADWFERARQLLITDEAMSNETVSEQATTAALDELWGLGFDYHRGFAQRVQKVRIEDVQRVARERLNSCVVTISTPKPELVKITPEKRTYKEFPPIELTPREIEHEMPVAR